MKFTSLIIAVLVLISGCLGGPNSETTITETTQPPIRETTTTTPVSATSVGLTVVNDKNCITCNTKTILEVTRTKLFPTVKVDEIDISTARGQRLIKELEIKALPAYIFDKELENQENFLQIKDALIQKGDKYIIHPSASEAGKYLNPPGDDDDPSKGDINAPVTIIEFSDFECPFCGKFFKETLPRIQEDYIDTGKARLVYRDFPLSFHKYAKKAAEAAECAHEQGEFWAYHDKLFNNQDSLGIESLKQYGADIVPDTDKFNECLDSAKYENEVQADMDDASTKGDVGGTPAFFINGIILVGALPFESFQAVIEYEVEAATSTTTDEVVIGYDNLSVQEFKALVEEEDTFVIDVHVPEQRHIKGTDAFIPYDKISENAQKLPADKSRTLAIYCRSGSMSNQAAQELAGMGYNVFNLLGGINEWKAAGYELQ